MPIAPPALHDTLLLFGATGDLSQRYLFPSLVHLLRDRLLPPNFRVVAIGRQEFEGPAFGDWLRGQLARPSPTCSRARRMSRWTSPTRTRWRANWRRTQTVPR